jgi:hypothetical protein
VSRLLASCILLILSLAAGRPTFAQQPIRIIFLHHSCGANLINEGGVREGLTALGHEFYDHGYNGDGLRLADGSHSGDNFDVPGDNTDPDGFAEIFTQMLHAPPDNTFSHLMQYDVIAFKSCFPVSNIGDDYQLDEYKSHYLTIRDRMDQYPDKIFIIVTQPPQTPAESDPAEAARARAFADWLQSDEYLTGHSNVFVFDFFGHLAGDDNFLRAEYRVDEYDAHPNERANREIGPLFVEFIDQAIRGYEAGELPPTRPTPTPPPPAELTAPPPTPGVSPPTLGVGMIDDFESSAEFWGTDTDGAGSTIECGPDTGMAHDGAASLHIQYSIVPDGWVGCGRSFESLQDWSDGAGVSLWLRSDGSPQWITLMLFSGDADAPTPFEVDFESTSENAWGWGQIGFPWADLARAEWADEGGLTELDPTRMTGYGFSLGAGESSSEGAFWVDGLHVSPGAAPPLVIPDATPTTAPAAPVEDVDEEPDEEETSGGEICAGAAVVLPLGMVVTLLPGARRRMRPRCRP